MKHAHHWIIDNNGLGKCKCGATKQFPKEKILKLRPNEVQAMNNLASDSRVDPDSWCCEATPEIMRGWT